MYSASERVKSSLPLLIRVLARGSGSCRQLGSERDDRAFRTRVTGTVLRMHQHIGLWLKLHVVDTESN